MRLEKLRVIAKVDEPTELVSQIVVMRIRSEAIQVCIDPNPLNLALKREGYHLPNHDDFLPRLSHMKNFTKGYLQCAF